MRTRRRQKNYGFLPVILIFIGMLFILVSVSVDESIKLYNVLSGIAGLSMCYIAAFMIPQPRVLVRKPLR